MNNVLCNFSHRLKHVFRRSILDLSDTTTDQYINIIIHLLSGFVHITAMSNQYLNMSFFANLLLSFPVKKFRNRLIFGEVMGKSMVSCFFDSQCTYKMNATPVILAIRPGSPPTRAPNAGGVSQNRRLSTNNRLYLENGKRYTHSFY